MVVRAPGRGAPVYVQEAFIAAYWRDAGAMILTWCPYL
jgi:hypothetical protein